MNEDSCLIVPRRGKHEELLPQDAILVFTIEDLNIFSSCFAKPVRRTHRLYLTDVYTGSHEGTQVAIAGPMLGAPQSVLVLERMIALGARKFIAAGWCGSLSEKVGIGDVVLPSRAISEEGTSVHYPGARFTPSPALTGRLRSAMESEGLRVHEGTVWSTDAPFRETNAKIRTYQSQGVLGVDMEASALFAVSSFRGVDLAVVLVVSDNLSGPKWVHGLRDPGFHESRQKVIKSTLTAICKSAESFSV